MNNDLQLGSSFRDPSGFVFKRQGTIYRQVNRAYQADYDRLMQSGLYERLVSKGYLIPHVEVAEEPAEPTLAYKILRPEPIPFISYPYEWCFSQLKDAALATLAIQKLALEAGMSLKDSSAYNIQFYCGRPVLMDTLSFEIYREGEPWVAYRQYCQHFLAPLALVAHRDFRLAQLLRIYLDGIPLDLTSKLLPRRTKWDFGLSMHIHLHATAQKRYAGESLSETAGRRQMNRTAFLGLIDSLQGATRKLSWKPEGTAWGEYYNQNVQHYAPETFEHKQQVVTQFLERIRPRNLWDLGANTGLFSRLASQQGIPTVAFDLDAAAVEQNYLQVQAEKETNLLPLVLDLTNPSPSLGWHHRERRSLLERGPADAVLALALIHHLAIGNNLPLPHLASFFRQAGKWLVIEFVPKEDTQVQKLLVSRQDIFTDYTLEQFREAFSREYFIREHVPLPNSTRQLFLMEGR